MRAMLAVAWLLVVKGTLMAAVPPAVDARLGPPRDLNTPVPPPTVTDLAAWQARRLDVRQQVLTAAGLQPMPARPAVEAHRGGLVEREGYSVEHVWFESAPGLVLGGNLYRPRGRGDGPFPAVLTPHGHMARGRLADDEKFSVPGRAINFARQGYVCFAYDMLGYHDTGMGLVHRGFATGDPRPALWGLTVFGLQTWDSLRALDFLTSLPEVDATRIGVTGESGGGTQTFILCAIDDRFAAAAPVNMISLNMQGGCLCENAPGLRVGTNNVEIGAVAAPRPMLMVAATGDWTKDTPTLEGPATKAVYALYGAADKLAWVQFDAPHNYHLGSREAVYAFFGRHLLGDPEAAHFREQPYQPEPDEALRAFADGHPPAEQLDEAALIERWIADRRQELGAARPRDAASLERFRADWAPALRHCLGVRPVAPAEVLASVEGERVVLGRDSQGDRVTGRLREPSRPVAALVVGDGEAVAEELLRHGRAVLTIAPFRLDPPRDPFERFFTGYNPTALASRVQDTLTALAWLQGRGYRSLELVGMGHDGLAALLARPFADPVARCVVDLVGLDLSRDETFTGDLVQPGLRRAGDFLTAALLCAPSPLALHHAHGLDATPLRALYDALGARLAVAEDVWSPSAVSAWLGG